VSVKCLHRLHQSLFHLARTRYDLVRLQAPRVDTHAPRMRLSVSTSRTHAHNYASPALTRVWCDSFLNSTRELCYLNPSFIPSLTCSCPPHTCSPLTYPRALEDTHSKHFQEILVTLSVPPVLSPPTTPSLVHHLSCTISDAPSLIHHPSLMHHLSCTISQCQRGDRSRTSLQLGGRWRNFLQLLERSGCLTLGRSTRTCV
jgi:hypothetical protein